MSEKRRALGRGLGALIPSGTATTDRPVDVFFRDQDRPPERRTAAGGRHLARPSPDETAGSRRPADRAEPGAGLRRRAACAPVPGAEFAEIPLDQIRPNPRQPRTVFDEDELAELVNSIREIGVLQPVVVRRMPDGHRGG